MKKISYRQIQKIDHDIFCLGMSFDVNGRMIISEEKFANKVNIYNLANNI